MSDKSNSPSSKYFPQKSGQRSTFAAGSKEEVPADKLLQGLRVHQHTLEMQLEALLHTQQVLENLLSSYVSLYDFAPVGYLTLSADDTIIEANLVSADLLGEKRALLLGQRFPRFIASEDCHLWHQHFYRTMQHRKTKTCEVKILKADGTQFFARLDCLLMQSTQSGSEHPDLLDDYNTTQELQKINADVMPLLNTKSLMMRIAIADITEKKLAEQELRTAAAVFESHEGMMVTDANNVILKVNHAFTKITGYTANEVIGKTPHMFRSGRHSTEFYIAMWAQIISTGAWQGEIWGRRKNGDVYPQWLTITAVKDKDDAVTNYVATVTDITSYKAKEDEIQRLAFYDPLTDLPNRRLLLDRLQRAMTTSARNRKYCALVLIDLDHFKAVNDNSGHDIGDLMLQLVAQRLTVCVRENDTVSRIGGDEFMVMLENLHENLDKASKLAEIIGEKMLTALRQPFKLQGHQYVGTASIGITLFINHLLTVAEIQKQADLAMYQAKTEGRNKLQFFSKESQIAKVKS